MPRATELRPVATGSAGFSLVEVLAASALSAVVVVAATSLLIPHLQVNQRVEGYARLQERWMRLAFLLNSEVQKASSISIGNNSLTITAPVSTAAGGATTSTITYYQQGTSLLRSGPEISLWGDLIPASATSGVLVLEGVEASSFVPQSQQNGGSNAVAYSINLKDPSSAATYTGRSSVARGRADCQSYEVDAGGSCD
jgi:prepilin-type N-terminal cleavage/methylation domain-containing protein